MTYAEIQKIKKKNVEIFHETRAYIRSGKSALTDEEMKQAISLDENDVARIREEHPVGLIPTDYKTIYNIIDCGSATAAKALQYHYHKDILVLNFASSTHPGGGVRGGSRAQEETLCRQSTLLYSLESDAARPYYDNHRASGTYLATDAIVFSPKVQFLRDDKYDWLEDSDFGPLTVSVLTCAAPHLFPDTHDSLEDLSALYYKRILGMLCVAMKYGCRNLVLGAWGCGAFKNDPKLVADAFCRALLTIKNDYMDGKDFFEVVFFAIPDAESENHKAFKKRVAKLNEDIEKANRTSRQKSNSKAAVKLCLEDRIRIDHADIVTANTDCIVNAANEQLKMGGGVCGAIFKAAGPNILSRVCNAIGHCDTGKAVITDGYHLGVKHIIHAVGPRWHGGAHNEEQLLYSCYQNSLELAMNTDCHSITFPLISAGIFGYPKDQAWEVALRSCINFVQGHCDYDLHITFAVLDDSLLHMGRDKLAELIDTLAPHDDDLHEEEAIRCQELESAIKAWHQDKDKYSSQLWNAFCKAIQDEAYIIVPVIIPDTFKNNFSPENAKPGDVITLEDELHISFQHLSEPDGRYWYAAFTSRQEFERGENSDTVAYLMKGIMEIVLEDENSIGLVINPWGENISLDKDLLKNLLGNTRPLSQDEKDLDAGVDAYRHGDYATAYHHYQQAADAGNVPAMSNLGYCYYYGRGVHKNKSKAKECWTRAAILGDACAIYKLGDMYRNGDCPEDILFSNSLYIKAFMEASRDKDLYQYPDACYRVVKYCKDSISSDLAKQLADDAVNGFKQRMDIGDPFIAEFYFAALELQQQL